MPKTGYTKSNRITLHMTANILYQIVSFLTNLFIGNRLEQSNQKMLANKLTNIISGFQE